MKTILVDDEIWMLEQFEDECNQIDDIQLIGKFKNPLKALDFAKTERIDLAFLDIEMPGMTGLELAEALRKLYPNIIIIFVSAYDTYMAEAFRSTHADYYILKPYKREDVLDVIHRVKLLSRRLEKRVRIRTFGRFDVFVDGIAVHFSSAKAKELLAVLVDHHGGVVDSEEAFSIMWEDKPYDHVQAGVYRHAVQSLQNTLREVDAENILVTYQRGRALNCADVDCDYFDFLDGDAKAVRMYNGEYMSNYSWGEYRIPMLDEQRARILAEDKK